MSHGRWENMRPIPGPKAYSMHDVQIGYVDGYLLCIEDVFKDLKEILTKHPVPTEAQELAQLLRRRLNQSREESQRTMRAFRRMAAQQPEGDT